MPKAYHTITQWDHWLTSFLGQQLLQAEERYLSEHIKSFNGSHAILIGSPQQENLLKTTTIQHKTLFSPMFHKHNLIPYIETDFKELPLFSGSVDLAILPHVLEFVDNPHKILTEVCRVIKPTGHIVILNFNPASLWGLKKLLIQEKKIPWTGSFLPAVTIKNWLTVLDFQLEKQNSFLFQPPVKESLFAKFQFMESIGRNIFKSFGGVYAMIARADVTPLTPIKLHWKQELPNRQIFPAGLPRPTTRNTP